MFLKTSEVIAPRHVELIEFTNKLLLLHLIGCVYYYTVIITGNLREDLYMNSNNSLSSS